MNTPTITAKEAEAAHLIQVYGQFDIEPVSANGVHIQCKDRELLDLYGGHAVAALGYSHPALVKALEEQAETLFFQSNAVALQVRATAADKLAAFAPDTLDHVFLVNSGAEANENALRIALRHTGRKKVVALEHGFHGRTAAAGAVTWGARDKWYAFPYTPFDVDFLPRDEIDAVEQCIDQETAAVIIELIQGVAGAYDLNQDFVTAIAKRCKDVGALLIVDEVQTGIGRCGQPFAADLYEVKPDLLTTAKALGGGFPCGAVITTAELAATLKHGDLGTTFGGGPLACALISTVIDVIQNEKLIENVQMVSSYLRDACPVGPVVSVQGQGFLLGLRCNIPARDVCAALLKKNILVGTSADPDVIRLLPSLTLTTQHIDELIDALKDIG
jgi:acetylornithine/N-succinyldiaminopimelate aminotransferase